MSDFVWDIRIQNEEQSPLHVELSVGDHLFLLGRNGSGKSALISEMRRNISPDKAKWILAHRKNWFQNSGVELSAAGRQDVSSSIHSMDTNPQGRWSDHYADARHSAALFDLVAADNDFNRLIRTRVAAGDLEVAQNMSHQPSPIDQINELLSIAGLTVSLSIDNIGNYFARHPGTESFPIAQLSDGERATILLAAEVLTARSGSVIFVDEPERHLHRSITEPLLVELFARKPDCAFVVSTHEIGLASRFLGSAVILVRNSYWLPNLQVSWDLDWLPDVSRIPDELRRALLGARERILFVEGDDGSLDRAVYTLLLENVSVVSMGGCRQVIQAVEGVRRTEGLHWITPFGLIDRDNRSDEEAAHLKERNIFTANVHSVESLLYGRECRSRLARQQAKSLGLDESELLDRADMAALEVVSEPANIRSLAVKKHNSVFRDQLMSIHPPDELLEVDAPAELVVTLQNRFNEIYDELQQLVSVEDLEGIVSGYPIKSSTIPATISRALRFQKRTDYQAAALSLIKRDDDLKVELRNKLGGLYEELS